MNDTNTTNTQEATAPVTAPVTDNGISAAILKQLQDNAIMVQTLQDAHGILEDKFDALQTAYDTQAVKNEAMEKSYNTVIKENAELKAQLKIAGSGDTKQEKAKIPAETFTVNGKKYKFVLAAWMDTTTKARITAVDALTDDTIKKNLVERQSGAIKEVVE